MSLKKIALEILELYRKAEESVIWEYSGDIEGELKELATEIEKYKKQIEDAAQPEQRWIPVSERLPEEDYRIGEGVQYSDDVLITVFEKNDDDIIIDLGCTRDGEWYSQRTDCFIPSNWKVTAWMPLPEPYKENQNENR